MARPICEIASEIRKYWENVNYAAKPYLHAMLILRTIDDDYGYDTAESVVLYFLANASSFRGEHARRIKQELKDIIARK